MDTKPEFERQHALCDAPLKPINDITTFSNGCLGSHNDEERSEMRYVMRIARPRESSNFERTLRFQVFLVACLSECQQTPLSTD
jgi:hypothetical protein